MGSEAYLLSLGEDVEVTDAVQMCEVDTLLTGHLRVVHYRVGAVEVGVRHCQRFERLVLCGGGEGGVGWGV